MRRSALSELLLVEPDDAAYAKLSGKCADYNAGAGLTAPD